MEQKAAVTLPEDPCFFLEADMGDYLLSFPIKQELQGEDLLDTSCMPDPTLEVYRKAEPLFTPMARKKTAILNAIPTGTLRKSSPSGGCSIPSKAA